MYPASIKPDQPSLDRRRRPGELSIPARYASIQRVPTGIRAVSDPQLVGHRLAMEPFEFRGGPLGGVAFRATLRRGLRMGRTSTHRPCEGVQKSQEVSWHKIRSERIWGWG